MSSSMQHKLDRVRRPRVQITYDVETNGAMERHELPFVVGVVADVSGKPSEPLKPLKERKVVNIDRDNFNDVLARATPRVAMKVPDRLTGGDNSLAVALNFSCMEDFEPARVAEQIEPLRRLLEVRRKLTQLLSKMEGNDKLEAMLEDVLTNAAKAQSLAAFLGVAPAAAESPAPESPAPAPAQPPAGGDDLDDLMKQLDNP
jgi:type VI secretion system protein ImpB